VQHRSFAIAHVKFAVTVQHTSYHKIASSFLACNFIIAAKIENCHLLKKSIANRCCIEGYRSRFRTCWEGNRKDYRLGHDTLLQWIDIAVERNSLYSIKLFTFTIMWKSYILVLYVQVNVEKGGMNMSVSGRGEEGLFSHPPPKFFINYFILRGPR